jgi:hypothetical protein
VALTLGRTQNVRNISYMWDQMWRASIHYGRKGLGVHAISAIDIALWDLLGKVQNEPVYNLLGGKTKARVPCYATTSRPDLAKDLGFFGAKVRRKPRCQSPTGVPPQPAYRGFRGLTCLGARCRCRGGRTRAMSGCGERMRASAVRTAVCILQGGVSIHTHPSLYDTPCNGSPIHASSEYRTPVQTDSLAVRPVRTARLV